MSTGPFKVIQTSIKNIWLYLILFVISFFIGKYVSPTWTVEKVTLDIQTEGDKLFYTYKGKPKYLTNVIPLFSGSFSCLVIYLLWT